MMMPKKDALGFMSDLNKDLFSKFEVRQEDMVKLIQNCKLDKKIEGVEFECGICSNILLEPMECVNCETSICNHCLTKCLM